MNNLLEHFNNKWKGKKVLHCDYMLSQMRITYNKIFFSCNCISNLGNFPFFHKGNLSFSPEEYLEHLDTLLTANLKADSICSNCKFATDVTLKELNFPNFELITFDYYKNCNGNCIYCFAKKEQNTRSADEIITLLDTLRQNNMIKHDCLFRYGGGEPTLLEDFDKLYDYIHSLKYSQSICTSGILYSKTIEKALKNKSQVIISPDSGSEQVFKKVKRTDKYFEVWDNIKQYSKFSDTLYIKYVIFCLNSELTEIEEFIRKCNDYNIKHVIIDCELYSASDKFKNPARITKKEIKAAIYLKELCIKNGIDYSYGSYWTDEHIDEINYGGNNN